jgi:hypothetical protein
VVVLDELDPDAGGGSEVTVGGGVVVDGVTVTVVGAGVLSGDVGMCGE